MKDTSVNKRQIMLSQFLELSEKQHFDEFIDQHTSVSKDHTISIANNITLKGHEIRFNQSLLFIALSNVEYTKFQNIKSQSKKYIDSPFYYYGASNTELIDCKILLYNQWTPGEKYDYDTLHIALTKYDCGFSPEDLGKLNARVKGNKEQFDNQPTNNNNDIPLPLNLILYGPPGTGKTYHTINKALNIIEPNWENNIVATTNEERRIETLKKFKNYVKAGRIVFTTFHQALGYEDFIEGIKPETRNGNVTYEVKWGLFKKLCWQANNECVTVFKNNQWYRYINISDSPLLSDENLTPINNNGHEIQEGPKENATNNNYVLIIDEINRGNVANIFGELITLIEESKRQGRTECLKVTLPYSGDTFCVPENLYIIGTMNTADRSVEALDSALRRRFVFEEMMPDASLLNEDVEGVNLQDFLETINKRIEVLKDREHQIGHSYLINVTTKEQLIEVIYKNIIPLLQEYFYGDYEKIQMVLGEGFVKREKSPVKFAVNGSNNYNDDGELYFIAPRPDSNNIEQALEEIKYDHKTEEQTTHKQVEE